MKAQKVRFANYRGEIIAIFQQDERDKKYGQQGCYMHVGQHSHGCPHYFKGLKSAAHAEYCDLLKELVVQVGYNNLQITNRQKFTAHRPPTKGEISFGHGATHYRDFTASEIGINAKGQLKNRFKADDGLYYSLR
jgi:hypothetical protein